jgi:hypothetical protein
MANAISQLTASMVRKVETAAYSIGVQVVLTALGCSLLAHPANATILYDGEWENFAPFYNPTGWTHGKNALNPSEPTDLGADTGHWADYVSFFGVNNPWLELQAKVPSRVVLMKDPTSPKHGMVARFEVHGGDYTVSGDRAEMVSMWKDGSRLPVTPESGHEFYGISVKLAPDWQAPLGDTRYPQIKWGIIMQLHSPNVFNAPPAIALSATDGFHLSMDSGDLLAGGARSRNKDAIDYPFADGSLNRGHWVEFIMDIKWSLDATGAIVVYRRDEGQSAFAKVVDLANLPTLTSRFGIDSANLKHDWCIGYYRSRNADLVNILWIGPVVRGTTFDEVAATAFGSTGPH